MENDVKILNISLEEKILDYDYDKIVIDIKNQENILKVSKTNIRIYSLYKALLSNDFMFYFHKGTKSYFIKRKLIQKIWQRKDLKQFKDLFYTLEKPTEKKQNKLSPLRMIVVFSSMGLQETYYNPNIGVRCFIKNFPTIQNSIVKNTMVMRIMDLNLSHGSHYINTDNYPDFEDQVQGVIQQVIENYDIKKDDVVLYGSSKGGTGALYHSLLGDYNCLCVDPIISLAEYNEIEGDSHYLKGLRKESILEDILVLDNKKFQYSKKIIGSPIVPFNYKLFSQLKNTKIKILDIFDENINVHSDISPNCISEQIMIINNFYIESENYKKRVNRIRDILGEIN